MLLVLYCVNTSHQQILCKIKKKNIFQLLLLQFCFICVIGEFPAVKLKKNKHHLLLQFTSLICLPCEKMRPPQKPNKQTTIATKRSTAELSGSPTPCLRLTVSTSCVFANLKRRLVKLIKLS